MTHSFTNLDKANIDAQQSSNDLVKTIIPFPEIIHKTDLHVPLNLFVKHVAKNHHEYPLTKNNKHIQWLLNPLPGINMHPKKVKIASLAQKLYHQQAVRTHTMWETLRNLFISILYYHSPFNLPKKKIDFVFLIHARYIEDYKTAFPFLNLIKKWSMRIYVRLIEFSPPIIMDYFDTDLGLNGVLITTPILPDTLMRERKTTQNEIRRVKRFLLKYCAPNPRKIVLGLGGWWPMVSRKGELFNDIFKQNDGFRVTTGHTATVYSLVSTTMQLINKSKIELSKVNVAILGCGNIGSHCAEFLLDLGVSVTLIDINQKKIRHLKRDLAHKYSSKHIHTALFTPKRIKQILSACHLGICATSNVGSIITMQQIPKHFIFIDDSRPEAIPRFSLKDKRYTLEGGLLSVHGLHSRIDYGFGNDHNTLGCLSESYLLACDRRDRNMVSETVGNIKKDNYHNLAKFCELQGITPGCYKMGNLEVEEEILLHALQKRHKKIEE